MKEKVRKNENTRDKILSNSTFMGSSTRNTRKFQAYAK